MTNFLSSSWYSVPNGGAKYKLKLEITTASQNVAANQSTINWVFKIIKDRSWRGFYDYFATQKVTIAGTQVLNRYNQRPNAEWPGWSEWTIASGSRTITHDADGTKTISVSASWERSAVDWSPGNMTVSGNYTIAKIARATTPTVTPSPASVGAQVTINLPRAVSTYTHDVTWECGTQSGTVGTGLGDSATWTVPNVLSEFPGQPKAPIVITAETFTAGAVSLGTRQVTMFAQAPPAAPTIQPRDVNRSFDVRARLVTYNAGEWLPGRLLPAETINMVDQESATATCSITLSKLNAADLPDYSIVDIDVYNGYDWLFTNHRFVLTRVESDDADPTRMVTYSGTEYLDYVMKFAYTQKDYEWTKVSPGKIILDILNDAKGRNWGTRVDKTFTAAKTSLDETWANKDIERKVSAGTPLSQVLDGLVTDGYLEYDVAYHSNKAWLELKNPGAGYNFADVGASPVVNVALAPLLRAPRRGTVEERITRVTVKGDDKVQKTREKTPFDADVFGHLEGWVAASGVTTNAEANTIGDNALRNNSKPVDERTFEYSAHEVAPQYYPYLVFTPGDWIAIPDTPSNTITDRISQITLDKQVDSFTITVLTGDRIMSGAASLAKRQSAQVGGAIGGGNGLTLSQLDSRIPVEPVPDTITSTGYWDSDGAAKSQVSLNWTPVVAALNGAGIDIALYEVWWRPALGATEFVFHTATADVAVEMPGWDVNQDLVFRVRARSADGVYGEFSEDIPHTTLPPAVSLDGPVMTDLFTDGVGNIYASWAGVLGTDPAPARLAYVTAEVSTDGGTVYTTEGTPITGPGSIVLNKNGFWGTYHVRLRGYDRLGNAGDASAPQTITLTDPAINPPQPLPPSNLQGAAGAGWAANGLTPVAWFDLEWDEVTDDVDGNLIPIASYELWGSRVSETTPRFLTSVEVNEVRYPAADGEEWSFSVRAVSNFGAVSQTSDAITLEADALVDPPDAPNAPTLSQYAGLLRVEWDGVGMEQNIKYAYAVISTSAAGPFTRAGMPLQGAGEVIVPGLAPDDYYAKIVVVDERGGEAASSAAGPITLLPITGVTIQTSPIANTGIKITDAALTAYDISGNPSFILDAVTGAVWIAPYDAVFEFGAMGVVAETGVPTTGVAISSESSSFNTFIHSSGLQIRNNQNPLSWWEADASDADLVNFVSPRARVEVRFRMGDFEFLRESKSGGASRIAIRYKGA